jgi:broad specificity phosphatase PhoE
MTAPSGESFCQFYKRYEPRLKELLQTAEATEGYMLAVTHVNNLLATTSILEGRGKDKIPVCGGPKTGSITIVERNGSGWKIHREDESAARASDDAATRVAFATRELRGTEWPEQQ